MTIEERIMALAQFIIDKHAEEARKIQGCKSGCWFQEIGIQFSFGEPIWFCKFGGYCFGDMSRGEEFHGKTFDELEEKVKGAIEGAIAEEARRDSEDEQVHKLSCSIFAGMRQGIAADKLHCDCGRTGRTETT